MKRMITRGLTLCLTLCVTTGCISTFDDGGLSTKQELIAETAIRVGTATLINHGDDQHETASKVVDIATEALLLVDNGAVAVIDELDERIHERMSELNLSPEKTIVAELLITMVRAEIEVRIGSKVLNPDTTVVISEVLKIMVDTAEIYR